MSQQNRNKKPQKTPSKPVKPTQAKKGNPIIQDLTKIVKSVDIKQLLIKNIAFIITGIIMWYIAPRITFIPFPSWFTGILAGAGLKLMVYFKSKNARKWRKDIEYGSARFGTPKDIKPFVDPNPKNNIILTKTESLTMNPRPKPVKYARNKNVLVIGGSGSGKTRFFVKPSAPVRAVI